MRYKNWQVSTWQARLVPRSEQPSRYRDKVYACICAYCAEHGGNPPTLREIMAEVGITSTSVANYNVKQLVQLGRLEIVDRKLCVVGARWIPPENGGAYAG